MRSAILACLIAAVLSALAVVYVRHQHRIVFVELQRLVQERDRLNTEWGQLLLEQSTFSFHQFVDKTARERLGMVSPDPEQIVVINRR